jgi:hypothetical protein
MRIQVFSDFDWLLSSSSSSSLAATAIDTPSNSSGHHSSLPKTSAKQPDQLTEIPTGILRNGEHAVAQSVEALHYKPEGRGFDSRWCHWNFSLT